MSATNNLAEYRRQVSRLLELAGSGYVQCIGLTDLRSWHAATVKAVSDIEALVIEEATTTDLSLHARALRSARVSLEIASVRIDKGLIKRAGLQRLRASRALHKERLEANRPANVERYCPRCSCSLCQKEEAGLTPEVKSLDLSLKYSEIQAILRQKG